MFLYKKLISRLESVFNIDAHYFVSNGFWLTINQVVTILGSLVVTFIFARLLSEQTFGQYRYLVEISVLFSIFSLTGWSQSIIQTTSKGYAQFYQHTMQTGSLYSLGIFVAGSISGIYYYINGNASLAIGCFAIAIFQPVIGLFFNVFSLLAGEKKFKESSVFQTIRVLIITTISAVAVVLTRDALILFIVFLVTQVIINSVGYYYFRPKGTHAEDPVLIKKYLLFAQHQSIQNGIILFAQKIDKIVIFQYLGAVELAVYSMALILPEQILSMIKNYSSLLLPKYASYTDVQFRSSIPKRSIQLFLILCIFSLVYILISPLIFEVIFPKYTSAILYSQLLALTIPTSVLFLVQNVLKSKLETRKLYLIQIIYSVIRICLSLVLIFSFGIIGAVFAFLISNYINLFIHFYFLFRK